MCAVPSIFLVCAAMWSLQAGLLTTGFVTGNMWKIMQGFFSFDKISVSYNGIPCCYVSFDSVTRLRRGRLDKI